MFKTTTAKLVGFAGTLAVSGALVAAAAGSTGAYFSDSRSGTLHGTAGSIKVTTAGGSGADGLDFSFDNLLPGQLQTRKATYLNTGNNEQDVWLVFPDATALHALNTQGRTGQVHVLSNGTEIFGSGNLNDDASSCPPAGTDCNPLPSMVKLADNVQPGSGGDMRFGYGIGTKVHGPASEEQTWLQLPYQIVATQDGILPNDPDNTPGNIGPGH